jgi:hypothetical protein
VVGDLTKHLGSLEDNLHDLDQIANLEGAACLTSVLVPLLKEVPHNDGSCRTAEEKELENKNKVTYILLEDL